MILVSVCARRCGDYYECVFNCSMFGTVFLSQCFSPFSSYACSRYVATSTARHRRPRESKGGTGGAGVAMKTTRTTLTTTTATTPTQSSKDKVSKQKKAKKQRKGSAGGAGGAGAETGATSGDEGDEDLSGYESSDQGSSHGSSVGSRDSGGATPRPGKASTKSGRGLPTIHSNASLDTSPTGSMLVKKGARASLTRNDSMEDSPDQWGKVETDLSTAGGTGGGRSRVGSNSAPIGAKRPQSLANLAGVRNVENPVSGRNLNKLGRSSSRKGRKLDRGASSKGSGNVGDGRPSPVGRL